MDYKAHYPSGEPGTHGREPFDEGANKAGGTDYTGVGQGVGSTTIGQESGVTTTSGGLGGSGGLATDSHGGTIARDTSKRDGEVVGLGAPKEAGSTGAGLTGSSSAQPPSLGAGSAAATGGTGLVAGGGASSLGQSQGQGQGYGQTHTAGGPASNTRSASDSLDRTGNLQQDAHKYESTGPGGPTTSGAAGTDRFDTGNTGSAGAAPPPTVEQDDSHRKGTGGIGGLLSTTDKEFTANPSRTGKGAYHDEAGRFQTNTSGPGGNTALTGREGTAENNPVAQAQSRSQGGDDVGTGEKKGVMDKIKDAFK